MRFDAMHVQYSIPAGHRYRWRPPLPPEIMVVIVVGFAAYFIGDFLLNTLQEVLPG